MSISIGKHIYSTLSASTELKSCVADRIYPITTKQETQTPFVLFKRLSILPTYTSDGLLDDVVPTCITVISNDYENSVEVAEIVRTLLECKSGNYAEFDVLNASLVDADEDYIEDLFVQKLFINFNTKKND